ncbi:15490_t:CDS:2, partial [Racocetra persica]
RANVDLKPILSIHVALQYISKYASKAEPRSEAFSQILDRILNNSNATNRLLAPVQKLLLHSISEHDISAQETCHLLLEISLYHSSCAFVLLNLNKETARWLHGAGVREDENYSKRANVDLKPILSIHVALQYISKYASKAEPRSEAFSQILDRILNNSNATNRLLAPVQKLLLHSISEHDISAQETCHLLLEISLYHSSCAFVLLNLNKETARWLHGAGVREDENY